MTATDEMLLATLYRATTGDKWVCWAMVGCARAQMLDTSRASDWEFARIDAWMEAA